MKLIRETFLSLHQCFRCYYTRRQLSHVKHPVPPVDAVSQTQPQSPIRGPIQNGSGNGVNNENMLNLNGNDIDNGKSKKKGISFTRSSM